MCQHVNLEGWQIGLIGILYFDEKSAKCVQAHYLAHDDNFVSQQIGQEYEFNRYLKSVNEFPLYLSTPLEWHVHIAAIQSPT